MNRRDDAAPDPDARDRRRMCWLLRGIWAADLLIQAGLLAGACVLAELELYHGYPDAASPLLLTVGAVLVFGVPAGYFARNEVYKAHWKAHRITPRGYLLGNAALFGVLELVTLGSAVSVAVTADALPLALLGVASLGVYAVNFPTGKPMRPHPPGFEP